MMTVEELIKKLQKLESGTSVYVDHDDGSYRDVEEVKVAIIGWPDECEEIAVIKFV